MAQANRSTSGSSSRQGGLAYQSLAGNSDRMGRNFTEAGRDSMGAAPRNGVAAGASFARPSSFSNGAMDRPIPVIIVGPRPLPVFGGNGSPGNSVGGSQMGFASGIAGRALTGGTAVVGAVSSLVGFADAVAKLEDNGTSARQKVLELTEAIPLLGGALSGLAKSAMSLYDRLSDPEKFEQIQRDLKDHPVQMARQDAGLNKQEKEAALARDVRSIQYEEEAVRQFPSLASQAAKGGRPISKDPRMAEAEEAAQSARRAVSVAQKEQTVAQSDAKSANDALLVAQYGTTGPGVKGGVAKTIQDLDQAEEDRASGKHNKDRWTLRAGRWVRRQFHGEENIDPDAPRTRPRNRLTDAAGSAAKVVDGVKESDAERQVLAQTAQAQIAEAQKLANASTEAEVRLRDRSVNLAQKQYELSKAEQEIQKAKLAILGEQEQKLREQAGHARSAATQFGGYDEAKQSATTTALESYQKNGRKGITQEQYELLSGTELTRGFVQEKAEKAAGGSEDYRKIMAMTKQKDAAYLDQEADKVGAEKMSLKSKVDVEFQFNEELLAKRLKDAFESVFEKLLRNMKIEENNTVKDAKIKQGTAGTERSQ